MGINNSFGKEDIYYQASYRPEDVPINIIPNTTIENTPNMSYIDLNVRVIGSGASDFIDQDMCRINYIIKNIPKTSQIIMSAY